MLFVKHSKAIDLARVRSFVQFPNLLVALGFQIHKVYSCSVSG